MNMSSNRHSFLVLFYIYIYIMLIIFTLISCVAAVNSILELVMPIGLVSYERSSNYNYGGREKHILLRGPERVQYICLPYFKVL